MTFGLKVGPLRVFLVPLRVCRSVIRKETWEVCDLSLAGLLETGILIDCDAVGRRCPLGRPFNDYNGRVTFGSKGERAPSAADRLVEA